jgi:hypothetical protein
MNKETMTVSIDGEFQQREIDYPVYRGKDDEGNSEFLHYPKLKPFEHIFEDKNGIKVFTSLVK